jgi:hypothetical protein
MGKPAREATDRIRCTLQEECPGSASKTWLGNRWERRANGTLPS